MCLHESLRAALHEHQAVLVKTAYFALAQQMEPSKHTTLWLLTQNANLPGAGGGMKRWEIGRDVL